MGRINILYKYAIDKYNELKKYELKSTIDGDNKAVIVRLDGKGMTKAFKKDDECFDLRFYETMYKISIDIIKYFPYILKTYSYKDEISILIDYVKFKDDTDCSNRQEKLLSILSGYVSSLFNKYVKDNDNIYSFDARIIIIPKKLVDNYFQARKDFASCAYFERVYSFYNMKKNGKVNFSIDYLLKHKLEYKIKENDLLKYLCFGISGSYINGEWVVSPNKNKVIKKCNRRVKPYKHKKVISLSI